MAITDIIPWNKGRDVGVRRDNDLHPFLALHREMNRMFDEVFQGFDLVQSGRSRAFAGLDWPRIDIDESEKEIRITAELPGLNEEDIRLEASAVFKGGVLSITVPKSERARENVRGVAINDKS